MCLKRDSVANLLTCDGRVSGWAFGSRSTLAASQYSPWDIFAAGRRGKGGGGRALPRSLILCLLKLSVDHEVSCTEPSPFIPLYSGSADVAVANSCPHLFDAQIERVCYTINLRL